MSYDPPPHYKILKSTPPDIAPAEDDMTRKVGESEAKAMLARYERGFRMRHTWLMAYFDELMNSEFSKKKLRSKALKAVRDALEPFTFASDPEQVIFVGCDESESGSTAPLRLSLFENEKKSYAFTELQLAITTHAAIRIISTYQARNPLYITYAFSEILLPCLIPLIQRNFNPNGLPENRFWIVNSTGRALLTWERQFGATRHTKLTGGYTVVTYIARETWPDQDIDRIDALRGEFDVAILTDDLKHVMSRW